MTRQLVGKRAFAGTNVTGYGQVLDVLHRGKIVWKPHAKTQRRKKCGSFSCYRSGLAG